MTGYLWNSFCMNGLRRSLLQLMMGFYIRAGMRVHHEQQGSGGFSTSFGGGSSFGGGGGGGSW